MYSQFKKDSTVLFVQTLCLVSALHDRGVNRHSNCQATWQKEHYSQCKYFTASREQYSGALMAPVVDHRSRHLHLLKCFDCLNGGQKGAVLSKLSSTRTLEYVRCPQSQDGQGCDQ